MTFIPEEELKERGGLTLAPMIDFLFLMLAVFASLAVSRNVMRDTDIELVKSKTEVLSSTPSNHELKLVHITINADGTYKWVTEIRDYSMEKAEQIAYELIRQHNQGLLPEDKLNTQVMVKIDREARWEPILNVLLAIKEAGFEVRPVYEPIYQP
ncbi:MAG TPA: biopolymer transporter ExbD [Waddliaceae bacterium]